MAASAATPIRVMPSPIDIRLGATEELTRNAIAKEDQQNAEGDE